MKKSNINILKLIIGVCIFLYVIFGMDFLDNIKESTASVSNVSTTTTAIKKAETSGNLNMYFINVGQADAILIMNNGHNMLVDAGNDEDGKKLVSYFKNLGIESFDYLVGTHPHEDHIGGMDDIIENFEIKMYLMPDKLSTSKTFENVLDALIEKKLTYIVPEQDDILHLGDAVLEVIHVGTERDDANDSSIILKLIHGNNSFLLMGDASSNVEKEILNEDIKSDVLKIGHHGSEYSSADQFINIVDPKYAVIEVGKNNIYNHPKQVTIDKLNKKNIKIYRTDMDGTIIFTSDGENINIRTEDTDTNG